MVEKLRSDSVEDFKDDDVEIITEYLGPKRLLYFFLNNIFNLKGNCAKKKLRYFLSVMDTYIYTHIYIYIRTRLGLINSLKEGCYRKRPKNFFVKTSWK